MTDGTKKVLRGSGRVAFLARLEHFQQQLDAGHTMHSIYADHRDELGISYPQFTRHVRKYVREPENDGEQKTTPTITPKSEDKPLGQIGGAFKFNPKAGSIDDLI